MTTDWGQVTEPIKNEALQEMQGTNKKQIKIFDDYDYTIERINLKQILLKSAKIRFDSGFLNRLESCISSHSHVFKGNKASASLVLQFLISLAEQAYCAKFSKHFNEVTINDLWDQPFKFSVSELAEFIYHDKCNRSTGRNNIRAQLNKLASVYNHEGSAVLIKVSAQRGHECVVRLQEAALKIYYDAKNYVLLPRELLNQAGIEKLSAQDRVVLFALYQEEREHILKDEQNLENKSLTEKFSKNVFGFAKKAYKRINNAFKHLEIAQLWSKITNCFNYSINYLLEIFERNSKSHDQYAYKRTMSEMRTQKGSGQIKAQQLVPRAQKSRFS